MFGLRKHKGRDEQGRQPLHCSFCNKSDAEVRKLIAGPTVHICDECVGICVDIIVDDARMNGAEAERKAAVELHARLAAKELNAGEAIKPADPLKVPNWHVRCELCHLVVVTDDALLVEARGILCSACAQAVSAAYEAVSKG